MIFFDQGGIRIHHDDALTCADVPASSVDLVVTSPPYNLELEYADHKDNAPYDKYLDWSTEWMSRCLLWLKPDGRFCLNIPLDKNKGGQQSVYADLTKIAKKVGFKYQSTIIWNEQNISRRTAWGSWKSASAPYVIAPVEMITVFYREHWKKQSKGVSDITRDEFMAWTNGVWTFNGESAKRIGHPAPFPPELPRRCIKIFSYVGDTVLDPFLGSGTTLAVAAALKRRGEGIELTKEYCQKSATRVSSELTAVAEPVAV